MKWKQNLRLYLCDIFEKVRFLDFFMQPSPFWLLLISVVNVTVTTEHSILVSISKSRKIIFSVAKRTLVPPTDRGQHEGAASLYRGTGVDRMRIFPARTQNTRHRCGVAETSLSYNTIQFSIPSRHGVLICARLMTLGSTSFTWNSKVMLVYY